MKDTSLPKGRHVKDRERYSILVDNLDVCVFCGRPRADLHEVFFGTAKRQASKDWGMVIPVCRDCHSYIHRFRPTRLYTQKEAQKVFEEKYGHEKFMEVFGKNYV